MEIQKLKFEIIIPAIQMLGDAYLSESAVKLLIGTCAVESDMGRFREQIGGGPARGIFQIEKATYEDLLINPLSRKDSLRKRLFAVANTVNDPGFEALRHNDLYSSAVCRLLYARHSEPLPDANDIEALARYWKKYYNAGGRGRVADFIEKYPKELA